MVFEGGKGGLIVSAAVDEATVPGFGCTAGVSSSVYSSSCGHESDAELVAQK